MSSVIKCDCGLYTFTWSIRNFSFCYENKGTYLQSPTFTVQAWGETEWILHLYPNGHVAVGYIACDLRLQSNVSIIATSTISIVAADGFSYCSIERVNQKFPNPTFSGNEHFVNRVEIFANKNFYLPEDALTIRCDIQIFPSEKQSINRCYIRSEIGIEHITFPWNIKRFSSLQLKQPLKFPLSLRLYNSPNFEIHIYLNGYLNDSSHVQIDIKKVSFIGKSSYTGAPPNYGCGIMMRCVVSILDSKCIPSLTVEGMRYFDSCLGNVVWQLPKIANITDLRAKKDLYLPDDILSLRFELAVRNGGMQSLPAEVHAVYPESRCGKPSSAMKDDFKLLYQEQKLCDITLKTASKTFKAHKAVLASRSPVFKAMFEHDMIESSSGIVRISDVDSKTLERLLFFMYADQLEKMVDLKSAIQLYCASDKYQINTLKECCYPILKSLVSFENVGELLPLAYKYDDDSLKTIVKAVICKHPSETMESAVWERVMRKENSEPIPFSFAARSEQLLQPSVSRSEPVPQFSTPFIEPLSQLSTLPRSDPLPKFSIPRSESLPKSSTSQPVVTVEVPSQLTNSEPNINDRMSLERKAKKKKL